METKTKIKKPTREHPRGLRATLVSVLVISAISGYAVNTYMLLHHSTAIQSQMDPSQAAASTEEQNSSSLFPLFSTMGSGQPHQPSGTLLEQGRDFLQKTTGQNSVSITFNGTMQGSSGTLALINNKEVTVGSDIEGVTVSAVSNNILTLEYQGEKQELSLGQTVNVELR